MFALTVPPQQKYLSVVNAFVQAVVKEARLDDRRAYRLRLAVEEAVSNVIEHGCRGVDSVDCGTIQIWAELNQSSVSITIEDTGHPFDITAAAQPDDMHLPPEQRRIGGLGVFLITRYVDDMRYERVNGHNINRLTIMRSAS